MYRTILVPLDGSPRAERILPHVEELAHRFESRVVFLQVLEPAFDFLQDSASRSHQERERESDAYLAGLRGEFREKGIRARTAVDRGPVVETIIKVANREGADLVAIASHGRGGISRVFYGSVAAGVLHQVDRPLLVIRARGQD